MFVPNDKLLKLKSSLLAPTRRLQPDWGPGPPCTAGSRVPLDSSRAPSDPHAQRSPVGGAPRAERAQRGTEAQRCDRDPAGSLRRAAAPLRAGAGPAGARRPHGPRRDPSGEKAKSGRRGRRHREPPSHRASSKSAALDTRTANARPQPGLPRREYARLIVTSSFAVFPRAGSGRRHDVLRKPIVLAQRHPVLPALGFATKLPGDAAATQKRSPGKPRSWDRAACAASAARSPTGAAMLGS